VKIIVFILKQNIGWKWCGWHVHVWNVLQYHRYSIYVSIYIETKYWMKMMWMTCTCLKCFTIPQIFHIQINTIQTHRGRRGHDCMAVGFTITYAISAYYHWCCEFKSRSGRGVQQYVIKFVGALRHVGGFHRVLRFSPPIKFTATI
jgi:hypothetical protein